MSEYKVIKKTKSNESDEERYAVIDPNGNVVIDFKTYEEAKEEIKKIKDINESEMDEIIEELDNIRNEKPLTNNNQPGSRKNKKIKPK
ncbi:MAG: hypothetical protein CMK63_11815 [Pseudoalteromonadaceae bacterium]|nr:hypothetical protein [Pseudoalteromonadaceae bacterium]